MGVAEQQSANARARFLSINESFLIDSNSIDAERVNIAERNTDYLCAGRPTAVSLCSVTPGGDGILEWGVDN